MFSKSALPVVLGVVFLLLVSSVVFVNNSYNRFSFSEHRISLAWRDLDEQLQKGYFLTAKLLNLVPACSKGEERLLVTMGVALARTNGIPPSNYTELVQAQSDVYRSLMESIGMLKICLLLETDQAVVQVLDELKNVEIKIIESEKSYNEAVTEYNASISKFPANIVAVFMGLREKPYFGSSFPFRS